jgi:hypothetical protein
MCLPAALPMLAAGMGAAGTAISAAAPFLTIASTALSVLGGINGAKAEKSQLKYQAAVENNNAIIADQNAKFEDQRAADARTRGVQEELQQRRKVNQLMGEQAASAAGAGVQVNSGSPLDIMSDTVMLGESDAKTIRQNAAREAFGYEQNAYNYRYSGTNHKAQSNIYQSSAKNISPLMAGVKPLLNGVSTLAGNWDKYRTKK